MSKFYWQEATIVELAEHIQSAQNNAVKQQINYYKLVDNKEMLQKIAHAKKYVLLWKLREQINSLEKELFV